MGFFDSLKKVAGAVVNTAKNVGHSVADFASNALGQVKGTYEKVTTSLGRAGSAAATTIGHAIETVYSDVKTGISNLPGATAQVVSSVTGSLKNVATGVIDSGGDAISKVGGSLTLPLTVTAGVAAIVLLN